MVDCSVGLGSTLLGSTLRTRRAAWNNHGVAIQPIGLTCYLANILHCHGWTQIFPDFDERCPLCQKAFYLLSRGQGFTFVLVVARNLSVLRGNLFLWKFFMNSFHLHKLKRRKMGHEWKMCGNRWIVSSSSGRCVPSPPHPVYYSVPSGGRGCFDKGKAGLFLPVTLVLQLTFC